MKALELKIPPVAVFLIAAASIYFTRAIAPVITLNTDLSRLSSYILLGAAAVIGIWAVLTFKLSKTTVNPLEIDKASALVSHGIFKFTRNPMYLALALVLLYITLRWQNVFGLGSTVLFILYMNRFQITPEERMLTALFGQDYTDYTKRVRRWI